MVLFLAEILSLRLAIISVLWVSFGTLHIIPLPQLPQVKAEEGVSEPFCFLGTELSFYSWLVATAGNHFLSVSAKRRGYMEPCNQVSSPGGEGSLVEYLMVD